MLSKLRNNSVRLIGGLSKVDFEGLVKNKKTLLKIGGSSVLLYAIFSVVRSRRASSALQSRKAMFVLPSKKESKAEKMSEKVRVDAVFFKRLYKILGICIPGLFSRESFLVACLSILLASRTVLSLAITEIMGMNVSRLVSLRWKELAWGILAFALITIPAAVVNSGLRYFSSLLSSIFRQRLSALVNERYIKGTNFYKACSLTGESRIDHADQRVTSDIEKFSEGISQMYSTASKPILDIILFTHRLGSIAGWQGVAILFSYFFISFSAKQALAPPLGKLAAIESELEGSFRTAHQRLIANSEEIALFDGSDREREILDSLFSAIEEHTHYTQWLRCVVGVFDGLLVKYWASIAGYATMAAPMIFSTVGIGKDTGDLTSDYIRNSYYMMGMTQAVGQLVLLGNKLSSLSGYTSRVSELLEMVSHLEEAGNQPFGLRNHEDVTNGEKGDPASSVDIIVKDEWFQVWREKVDSAKEKFARKNQTKHRQQGGGKVVVGDIIKFDGVDIVSPDGKVLVEQLHLEVPSGCNVMVTGPNGVGKSSLFRVIGGLWPLHCGTLTKPKDDEFLIVPQKPYAVLGTLRDQIIYPHNKEEMEARGFTDFDLKTILDIVDPTRTMLTVWDLDEIRDWIVTFSGGQKQRVGMARLFYHKPKFAILDEATNAMSDEIENKIYFTAAKLGITLFTISHRVGLQTHHDSQLKLNGDSTYEFTRLEKGDSSTTAGSFSY